MTYRILVDENTSPRVAELLDDRDREAVHVTETLDVGVADRDIVAFAREEGYVVLTHDDDFLLPAVTDQVSVLYYSDDTLDTGGIAERAERVIEYVPDPADLPPVTYLGTWE